MKDNELTKYLNKAITNIITSVISGTFNNSKETAFLLKFRRENKKADEIKTYYEVNGHHIPGFLIASITNSCNLYCKGCYARNNGICSDESTRKLLSAVEWENIFSQASKLGIDFILLAGGEPLMRHDAIEKAAAFQNIIFPVFTNGTMIDRNYCVIFDECRNIIPVISLEGSHEKTDARRGKGVFLQLMEKMKLLQEYKILFGVSITVTKENFMETTHNYFIDHLESFGCRVIFYIEYVPVDSSTEQLAFNDIQRCELEERQDMLREKFPNILFLSFPGDEKSLGGCLAAGRGFFHISPYGEAEPCPFSPYSELNIRNSTLLEILNSDFFKMLQAENLTGAVHKGGCALFEREAEVKKILERKVK